MVEHITGRPVILRRRTAAIAGASAVAVGLIGTAYLLLMPSPDATLSGRLQLVAAMVPVLWFVWLAAPHPRIQIHDDKVTVVNLLTRTTVPLSCVDSVEAADVVIIKLTTGRQIKPIIGVPAISDRWHRHDLQQDIKDALESARAQSNETGDTGEGYKRRVDVAPLFPVVFGLCLVIVAWIAS